MLSDHARAVLAGVRDRTKTIEGAGMYVLLEAARERSVRTLTAQSVAVRNAELLERPDDYRGRLVRVRATYVETREFQPANRRRYSKPIHSTLAVETDSLEPISIITVDAPGRLRQGVGVVLTGYFLKLRSDQAREPDPDTGDDELIVPVLVGRAVVVEPRPIGEFDVGLRSSLMLVAGVVVLAVFWFRLRARANRRWREERAKRPRDRRPTTRDDSDELPDSPIDLDALERDAASNRTGHWTQAVRQNGDDNGEGP